MAFGLYYPDFATSDATWVPNNPPLPGSIPGRVGGLIQQRTATGRKINWRQHPKFRTWRLEFEFMTDTDIDERETFWDAASGATFEVDTDFETGLFTATFVGQSLNFSPQSLGAGFYRWTEEIEEQPDVSASILDPSIARAGYVDISGTNTTGAATFASNYPDANYIPTVTSATATNTGDHVDAHIDEGSLTASGFTIELEAAPGTGNTVRVYWKTLRL